MVDIHFDWASPPLLALLFSSAVGSVHLSNATARSEMLRRRRVAVKRPAAQSLTPVPISLPITTLFSPRRSGQSGMNGWMVDRRHGWWLISFQFFTLRCYNLSRQWDGNSFYLTPISEFCNIVVVDKYGHIMRKSRDKNCYNHPLLPLQAQLHLQNQQHRPLMPHFNVLINILILLKTWMIPVISSQVVYFPLPPPPSRLRPRLCAQPREFQRGD